MEGQTMAAFLVSMAAAAAAASPAQPSGAARDVHGHSVQSETIIVTAPFVRDRIDSLTPVSVLTRETLAREMRSEEHTSELQSLMRISYAVFCLKKKKHIAQD